MTLEEIRAHFGRRLERAELEMWPFPHLYLTEVLPAEVYDAALAGDPFTVDPGVSFGDPSWTSKLRFNAHYEHRYQHELNPENRTWHEQPWAMIGDAFADPNWLGPVLRMRFPSFFDLRFGDIDAIESRGSDGGFWRSLHTRTFVQRHEPGYRLEAHTDIPSRIATCIFNFPPSTGFEDAGTTLLKPRDPRVRCWGNSHHNIGDFEVVNTVPYAPNTCLVFFKTRHSWHSVRPEAALVPGGRLGMQVQLYEPDEGALIDLSAPDLVRNLQFVPEPPKSRLRVNARRVLRQVPVPRRIRPTLTR